MLLYVNQKMFVQLKGAKSNKSNNRKKEECKMILTKKDMPDKWIFNGWFVFVLYEGPEEFAPTSLSCMSEDGKDVPKIGHVSKSQRCQGSTMWIKEDSAESACRTI